MKRKEPKPLKTILGRFAGREDMFQRVKDDHPVEVFDDDSSNVADVANKGKPIDRKTEYHGANWDQNAEGLSESKKWVTSGSVTSQQGLSFHDHKGRHVGTLRKIAGGFDIEHSGSGHSWETYDNDRKVAVKHLRDHHKGFLKDVKRQHNDIRKWLDESKELNEGDVIGGVKRNKIGELHVYDNSNRHVGFVIQHSGKNGYGYRHEPSGTAGISAASDEAGAVRKLMDKHQSWVKKLRDEHKKNKHWIKEEELDEKYIGFDKLKNKLAHKKGISDPGALAASIGRKKYGAKRFANMSHKEEVEFNEARLGGTTVGKIGFSGKTKENAIPKHAAPTEPWLKRIQKRDKKGIATSRLGGERIKEESEELQEAKLSDAKRIAQSWADQHGSPYYVTKSGRGYYGVVSHDLLTGNDKMGKVVRANIHIHSVHHPKKSAVKEEELQELMGKGQLPNIQRYHDWRAADARVIKRNERETRRQSDLAKGVAQGKTPAQVTAERLAKRYKENKVERAASNKIDKHEKSSTRARALMYRGDLLKHLKDNKGDLKKLRASR